MKNRYDWTTTPIGILLRHDKAGFMPMTREHINQKVTSCQPRHQDDCTISVWARHSYIPKGLNDSMRTFGNDENNDKGIQK
ncbi:MAG: hypothetical protein U9N12_04250 [Euryarchaeota archaeon]|nr:hypothetical protein [Euryarchaeota archaeon]